MALEPQPHPGSLAGAAAGPAGRAVETPYAAAAALSHAPGIGAGNPSGGIPRGAQHRNPLRSATSSQTTPPHGAMQRGRRWRGKSGGPPRPREQIRPPQSPVSACKLAGEFVSDALNLFHSLQTKPCLGHCITRGLGLRRQATILRLRGAVLFSGSVSRAGAGIRTRPRG
jgi:hypothetical protein